MVPGRHNPIVPAVSDRAVRMPASPIRRLVGFALDAETRGVTVHKLNIGQPDVHSPAAFWRAVANPTNPVLEYSHSAGIAPLRAALSDHYRGRGIDVTPDEILVTTGGSEACLIAMSTLFDPGDECVVVEPFYANYLGFATQAGVALRPLTSRIEEDFALPSPDAFAGAIGPRTKGILLCNPSNPTGTAYSPDSLRAIARLCVERDLWLIVDEVYRDFYYGDAADLLSVLNLAGLENRAVMVDSASKKFSLCGARVGFLVTRNREVMGAALKFGQARLAAPTLDQEGVAACLRECGDEYFVAVREEYRARRDVVTEELAKIPGVVVPKIAGAFYAVVRLPIDDSDRFCRWMMESFHHEGESVLMAPATGFYATPGLGRDEVRIAYVLEIPVLRRAIRALAAGLSAYNARATISGDQSR